MLSSDEALHQSNAVYFLSFEVEWWIIGIEADQPHAALTLRWHYLLYESPLSCGHRIDFAPLKPKGGRVGQFGTQ